FFALTNSDTCLHTTSQIKIRFTALPIRMILMTYKRINVHRRHALSKKTQLKIIVVKSRPFELFIETAYPHYNIASNRLAEIQEPPIVFSIKYPSIKLPLRIQ